MKIKSFLKVIFLIVVIFALTACVSNSTSESTTPSGQTYLYGEQHAVEKILEKELELWHDHYYKDDMRHLFVELPYYTAESLNLWMKSDNDDILQRIFANMKGSSWHSPNVKDFFIQIKNEYPETIFHGTDVGHQHETEGQDFLKYLKENNLEQSEQYYLTQEIIEQGKHFYENSSTDAYRENKMVENFIREFETLDGESIMGIYGSAHTGLDSMAYNTDSVPSMANQLKQRYGDSIHSEDLSWIAKDVEPIKVDAISINKKDYETSYFGKYDITGFENYVSAEFWRLENAYNDFKDSPKTGEVLPYDNYPMLVEEGQILIIEYTKTNASTERCSYRSNGKLWKNQPATEAFLLEESY